MRWTAALVVSVALAAHASAGPDETQACRDAWAERMHAFNALVQAHVARNETAVKAADARIDATGRRFVAAFASVPFDAWDPEKDKVLFDDGLSVLTLGARARGDLTTARRAVVAHVTKLRTSGAFTARGVSLPELDLAAADIDAALRRFRAGVRQPRPVPSASDDNRRFDAHLQIGDVLAACGDLVGARAEYAAAKAMLDSLDRGLIDAVNQIEPSWLERMTAQLTARELVGKLFPQPPKLTWIGDAPKDAQRGDVVVLYAGRVGSRGDAGRLRELDRLSRETAGRGVAVRIVVTTGNVGVPVPGTDAVSVVVPSGPDDSDGKKIAYDAEDRAAVVATIRERLGLQTPIALSDATGLLAAPLGALVLVCDKTGTIVHASVDDEFTDWVCGIARIVADGKKPSVTPVPPIAGLDQVVVCSRNLATLAEKLTTLVQHRQLMTKRRALTCSGAAVWFALREQLPDDGARTERLLICPADSSAFVPTTFSDGYLWNEADPDHPPAGLCSYAGRDFTANPVGGGDTRAVIGACLHHPGCALVARADGTVTFVTLKDLGIASDAEKTVGPDSKSPLLRVLR